MTCRVAGDTAGDASRDVDASAISAACTYSECRSPSDTGTSATYLGELGGNTFLAKGVIFTTGSGGTPNPHGTPQEWKKKGEEVEQAGSFTAKINF